MKLHKWGLRRGADRARGKAGLDVPTSMGWTVSTARAPLPLGLRLLGLWLGILCWLGPAWAESIDHAEVRVADSPVVALYSAPGLPPVQRRAQQAAENLERVLEQDLVSSLRVQLGKDAEGKISSAKIYAGQRLVLQLTEADRKGADAEDLVSFADETLSKIRQIHRQEQRRSSIAKKVLAFSTVIFFGLVALLAIRALGAWSRSARRFIKNKNAVSAVRLGSVELLPAGAAREGISACLSIGSFVAQFFIFYAWIVTSLSLFETTRGVAELATGKLLAPAFGLLEHLAGQVPVVLSLLVAFLIVALVIRFVLAYFAAVERGEVQSEWVHPEAARITGHLLSIAVGIAALLFIAPLLTGQSDGVFTRVGELALGVFLFSTTPLLASCALGIRLVYGRRLRRGDRIGYGGQVGQVVRVGLFELVLSTEDDTITSVPHLFSLWHPTHIYPPSPSDPASTAEKWE